MEVPDSMSVEKDVSTVEDISGLRYKNCFVEVKQLCTTVLSYVSLCISRIV